MADLELGTRVDIRPFKNGVRLFLPEPLKTAAHLLTPSPLRRTCVYIQPFKTSVLLLIFNNGAHLFIHSPSKTGAQKKKKNDNNKIRQVVLSFCSLAFIVITTTVHGQIWEQRNRPQFSAELFQVGLNALKIVVYDFRFRMNYSSLFVFTMKDNLV